MPRPRGKKHPARMSVSLDGGTYAELRALSREYDVSAAWILRRAVEAFIERNRTAGSTELPLARASAKGRGGNPR
jgi:predicted transcriptional regulator